MSLLLRYDPDGGELGNGVKVSILELVIVVPHVANILAALEAEGNLFFDKSVLRPYKYGFQVYPGDRKLLEIAVNSIELPSNVQWYESDGNKIFAMRGPSGGVISGLACYLVTK